MSTDLKSQIQNALQAFDSKKLRASNLALLKTLGYASDKTVSIEGANPQTFLDYVNEHSTDNCFDTEKALFNDWKSADLLFQLTDEELSRETSLFPETSVKTELLRSYPSSSIRSWDTPVSPC